MKQQILVAVAAMTLAVASLAAAQDVFVYPQKGQSKEQQEQDEFACYKWAKEQTGTDPAAAGQAAPDRSKRARGTLGGAAKGAAAGAAIGAIAGDAGKGAAIGAAGGGVMGRRGAKQGEQAAAQSQHDAYNRAFGACMEGRGYTVK
jgi:hypothetical protein